MNEREQRSASNGGFTGKITPSENVTPTSETRKKRFRDRWMGLSVLALGVILVSPAVRAPLFLDDYLQGAMVDGTYPVPRSPFDLYAFYGPDINATLMARGLLPWWSDPALAIRFFRPLSSVLLWFDHRVFAHAALPMHLHSLAWWFAAVFAARALFSRVLPSRIVLLSTAIFALSPCHAMPIGWVANRETLISLTFGALGICTQARFRDERHIKEGALSALWFALAFLGGGEYALCLGGYVVAMDVSRREGLVRRITGWLPYALPAVGYLVVRGFRGYGAAGSAFYSDPIRDPMAFLAEAPWRLIALLARAWLTVDADAWVASWPRYALVALVLLSAVLWVRPLRSALVVLPKRQFQTISWLLVGSFLALLPLLAVFPGWRVLGVSMLGVAPVVAFYIDHMWFPRVDEAAANRATGSLASLAALALGFAHCVHGPGTLYLASEQQRLFASSFVDRATWIRTHVDDTKSAKLGIVRGAPPLAFLPFALDSHGSAPARFHLLSMVNHVLVLRRDTHTIDLVASLGQSLYPVNEQNLYRKTSSPLRAGDEVALPGMRVTILEASEVGPRSARFVFDEDLGTFRWFNEGVDQMSGVELPSIGFGEPFDP